MNFKYLLPNCIRRVTFLCIFISVTVASYAQLNSGNLTQFTEKDGLPGVVVSDVFIDRLGYVWAGTLNGLTQYDGYTFKRFYFNPNDTNTIHGLAVMKLTPLVLKLPRSRARVIGQLPTL